MLEDDVTGNYFQHYATADPSSWDLHTAQSYWKMADLLAYCFGRVLKGHFERVEKNLGLVYSQPTRYIVGRALQDYL